MEAIGMSNMLLHNMWLYNFISEQVHAIKENILYHDNHSAMKKEHNGRNSCTCNLRHISINYFFVKDRVDKAEVTIQYCPSEYMLPDYLTKPLQSKMFKLYCDIVMGHQQISYLVQNIT